MNNQNKVNGAMKPQDRKPSQYNHNEDKRIDNPKDPIKKTPTETGNDYNKRNAGNSENEARYQENEIRNKPRS